MFSLTDQESVVEQYPVNQLAGAGLAWLDSQRQQAGQHFANTGLPQVRDEEWRYTNLRSLKQQPFAKPETTASAFDKASLPETTLARLVFVDGIFQAELSDCDAVMREGLSIQSLADVLSGDASAIEAVYGSTLPSIKEQHGFTALNTLCAEDGYVIIAQQGVVVSEPLEVLFMSTAQSAPTIHYTRSLIVLEPNSQLTVIERHVGLDDAVYLSNAITEVIAGDNSHLDHYKIQQESEQAFHFGGIFIHQKAHAQVRNHNATLTGLVTRNDISTDLIGQGAHMEMNGLVIGRGNQHIDNHTQVNHLVPNCTSDEFYKTVLDDTSRAVFRGRILVAQDAQLTNAEQQNNNLLLSDQAEADSKPQLEIYADDVKCSHGATVGQLDDKSIFYLNSRGIDEASARALLTFAFANEVIDRVKVDSIKEEMTNLIAGALLSDLDGIV
ncbi:MAG: Fe-S cluster assembly protein SufD [Pseudomonadota bacterium]